MSEEVKRFIRNFPRATELISKNLKSKPFNVRGPLNTSAFDSIFCVIINHLDAIPLNLQDRYSELLQDQQFIDYTSLGTTDTKTVKERYRFVKSKLID